MKTRLHEQVILITGASGSIGSAIARALAGERASLVLHGHQQIATCEQLAHDLDTPAHAVPADLGDESAITGMFERACEQFDRIDHLVVNAGIWISEAVPLHEMTLAQWNRTMQTDLTSAFLCCRAFLQHLRDVPRESASIVLMGSTAAMFGEANHADYAAAKAGMVYGLMRTLKNEIVQLAPHGRVNAICPGWVETPMAADALADPNMLQRTFATQPLAKVASVDDIATATVFLLSEATAGHISGTVMPIHGGMEGRLLRNPTAQA